MFDEATRREIAAEAARIGVEPAALLAVAEVESAGAPFWTVDGEAVPPIRFEGHYFHRRLSGEARGRAVAEGLASPLAGAVKNPSAPAARYDLLERAMQIDRVAALESISMGLGQVMGAHWRDLGYPSVGAMWEEACSGVAGQVRLMVRFIEENGLADELRRQDWAGFAARYNGPAYRQNRYDAKMENAFRRYRGGEPAPSTESPSRKREGEIPLRRGDRGEAVRAWQARLAGRGYAVAADGVFGPATEAATKRFQRAAGLACDGIAGPATSAAMTAAEAKAAPAKAGAPGRTILPGPAPAGRRAGPWVGFAIAVALAVIAAAGAFFGVTP